MNIMTCLPRYRTTALWLVVAQLSVTFPAESQCSRVNLSRDLTWVTSGVWDEEGRVVLLADTYSAYVLGVDEGGRVLVGRNEFELISGVGTVSIQMPSFLHRDSFGDIHLEDEAAGAITKLDEHLFAKSKPQKFTAKTQSALGPARVIAVYGWQPMENGYLAFGDIEFEDVKGPGRYKSAFLQFNSERILQIFDRPMDTLSEVRNHYLRNMPYIATLDGKDGYLLDMGEVPSVRRVRAGVASSQELSSFPEDFRACPRLIRDPKLTRALRGSEQATLFYERIESSRMAAGLFSWDGRLYLVAKEAMTAEQDTTWWVIELDPQDGAEISRERLPTSAAHITLVPGSRSGLALIEKGPVVGVGDMHWPYMATSSMVLCR